MLEISTGTAAAYAGLLIAELGFAVDRVDLDPRHPFDDEIDADDADEKARQIFLHRGKNVVGSNDIDVTSYDAVIEDCGPQMLDDLGLGYASVRTRNPNVVFVSLSYFGLTGPYSQMARDGHQCAGRRRRHPRVRIR